MKLYKALLRSILGFTQGSVKASELVRLVKITDEARGRLLQDQGKILADKDVGRLGSSWKWPFGRPAARFRWV